MEEKNLHVGIAGMRKLDGESKTKAFVDLSINNAIVIKGFKIVNGSKGLFLGMPGRQGNDGKWYNNVLILDEETKTQIQDVVLSAYENEQA